MFTFKSQVIQYLFEFEGGPNINDLIVLCGQSSKIVPAKALSKQTIFNFTITHFSQAATQRCVEQGNTSKPVKSLVVFLGLLWQRAFVNILIVLLGSEERDGHVVTDLLSFVVHRCLLANVLSFVFG